MLQKQAININFSQGLDTKTDPWQVQPGKFLNLQNAIFTKAGLFKKRNGYKQLTSLPDQSFTYLTTFKGGLTAIGEHLNSYSQASEDWVDKGKITPLDLSVQAIVHNNFNQIYADSSISENGLVLTSYIENNNGVLSYKYIIEDLATTQTIVPPTLIQGAGVTTFAPRVFFLAPYFLIVFDDVVAGVNHLKYIAISTLNPATPLPAVDISTQYVPTTQGSFDGTVVDNKLFLFFNSNGPAVRATYITHTLQIATPRVFVGGNAGIINVTYDLTGGAGNQLVIWGTWDDTLGGHLNAVAVDTLLNTIMPVTLIQNVSSVPNVTAVARDGVLTVFYEQDNSYPYDAVIPTHFIRKQTINESGTVTAFTVLVRSVGLASKAFIVNGVAYFLALYISPYQSTYFLINELGQVVAKLAYENAPRTYYVNGLPSVNQFGKTVYIPYLINDLIQAVNKDTNVPAGTQVNGIYTQTGVNLARFIFGTEFLSSSEIGDNLNLTGGYLIMYDGVLPVEQGFYLYPDSVEALESVVPGGVAQGTYFYQVTYEWTDNQGNLFRSAPSIPIKQLSSKQLNSIELHIPTLRLTYKLPPSPVKIVIYRWSLAQQVYYQVTSITAPLLNDTTIDFVTYIDSLSDAQILGNNILYTTGGVVENIGAPATSIMTLFQQRLWLVHSEDRNLLWFSKLIIESTPVEMSDLFTIFVAPTTAAQGSTGPITALSSMDDKLIIFKNNAIYYINGIGPDNTGNNNQFSEPIFITATVGCDNPHSIVFIPQGLMFQSDKGIWLLGRDLSTTYIGAAVEEFNSFKALSSLNVPAQNQCRFTLDNGVTLMYDYFFNQWGTFVGIPGISSTIYQEMHTFIDKLGRVFQETIGQYLDGSNPVLMSFRTSWFNLAGVQGYQRAFFFYLLGKYLSPHKLQLQIAYDYNDSPTQSVIISPDNLSTTYGGVQTNQQVTVYGQDSPYGGPGNVEQWRVFLERQRCEAFQITINEFYDPSFMVAAGEGLTFSGLNLVVAIKKGFIPIKAGNTVGL